MAWGFIMGYKNGVRDLVYTVISSLSDNQFTVLQQSGLSCHTVQQGACLKCGYILYMPRRHLLVISSHTQIYPFIPMFIYTQLYPGIPRYNQVYLHKSILYQVILTTFCIYCNLQLCNHNPTKQYTVPASLKEKAKDYTYFTTVLLNENPGYICCTICFEVIACAPLLCQVD